MERGGQTDTDGEGARWDLRRGLVVAGGALVGLTMFANLLPDAGDEGADMAQVDFAIACEREVERRLVQPHTANFPWAMSNDVRLLGEGRATLRSHVESMNLVGATIRRMFTCYGERVSGEPWDVGVSFDPL